MTPTTDAAAALIEWSADPAADPSAGSARARFRFPSALPVFIGHFPGRPLVPGVYQLAAVAETARRAFGQAAIVGVERAKWSAPAFPEQDLDVTVRWRRAEGRIVVDGAVAGPAGACAQCRLILQE